MQIEEQLNRIEGKIDKILSLNNPVIFNKSETAIRNSVIDYFNITIAEFISPRQVKNKNILPRTFFYFFARSLTDIPLRAISKLSSEEGSERNHATILNGISNVCNWLEINDKTMLYHYNAIYHILERKGFDMNRIPTFLQDRTIKQNSSLKHIRNA